MLQNIYISNKML